MELLWAQGIYLISKLYDKLRLREISFSHEEPMMRSIPVEWGLFGIGPWNYSTNAQNVYNFWVAGTERAKPYESIFTIGMRGDGDCKYLVNLFSTGTL